MARPREVGVINPLHQRREPDFAAERLDFFHKEIVAERMHANINFPDNANRRLFAGFVRLHAAKHVRALRKGGIRIFSLLQRVAKMPQGALIGGIRLARVHLIGAGIVQGFIQQIAAHQADPRDFRKLRADFFVKIHVLIRRKNRNLMPQLLHDKALEQVVLPKAARPGAGRHEERRLCGIKARLAGLFHHVAGRDDERIALFAGRELPPDFDAFPVRKAEDFRRNAQAAQPRRERIRMIAHVRNVQFPAFDGRGNVLAERALIDRIRPAFDIVEAVEKRLAARDCARRRAVFVNFDGQRRLFAHNLLEIRRQEGIRAAAEIRDVERVQLRMIADEFARFQDALAVFPEHVRPVVADFHVLNRQKIHRNRQHAEIAQDLRQAEIDARIAAVINAADDDDGALLLAQRFQNFLPALDHRAAERALRPLRHVQRPVNFARAFPELTGKRD